MRVDGRGFLDALVLAEVDVVGHKERDRLGRRALELRRLFAHRRVRLEVFERSASVGQAVDGEDNFGASGGREDELLCNRERQSAGEQQRSLDADRRTLLTRSMSFSSPASTKQAMAIPICCVCVKPGATSTSPIFFACRRRARQSDSRQETGHEY